MIKVRCWDKKKKRWAQPARDIYKGIEDTDRFVWQRYITDTVYDDSEAKEVYEGDIVSFHYFYDEGGVELEKEIVGTVVWRDHYHESGGIIGCFALDMHKLSDLRELIHEPDWAKDDAYPIPFWQLFSHDHSFIVLGNIFENPELK